MIKFNAGEIVEVIKETTDKDFAGLRGRIVPNSRNIMIDSIGVDFGIINGYTWELSGLLPGKTGRYMSISDLKKIQPDWDE